MSLSLLASSSFRKSLVFCARSFLCVRVSRWCATRSEATVSSCGMSVVRSMSGALSAYVHSLHVSRACVLRHAPMAFWNLLPSSSSSWVPGTCVSVLTWASIRSSKSIPPSMFALHPRTMRVCRGRVLCNGATDRAGTLQEVCLASLAMPLQRVGNHGLEMATYAGQAAGSGRGRCGVKRP